MKNILTKLLIITTIPATLRAFLLPFAQHFKALGWQVDAMANGVSNCEECKECFDHVWEICWSRNPLDPRNLMAAPKQIQAIVEKENYDIVHVHTPVAAFVTRFALRKLRKVTGTKVIYTAHGFHFYKGASLGRNFLFRIIEEFAGSWTDYLVTINKEDFEAARNYHLAKKEQIRYMPGIGIDTTLFNYEKISLQNVVRIRNELKLKDSEQFFLMIAEKAS